MSVIVKWWRSESAMIVAVALAVVGAGVVSGTWQRVLLAVLPLVAGGAVRQTVWAPDTVQAAVQSAASPPAGGGGATGADGGATGADLIGRPSDPQI